MENPEVKGTNPITDPKPADAGVGAAQTPVKMEDVEKMIALQVQRETDRVRSELYPKLKAKDTEIEELKKSKMSEAEIRKYKEEQLSQREKELQQKELVIVATDSLRDSNLPIDFREFVIAEDPDKTKARVLLLKDKFQKAVESAVAEKFKATGHDPAKGEPAKSRRIWTRSEIARIPKAEYAKYDAEITAAMLEGRVKPE
ncbi:MAG: DUF4355 domain-containing protein [Pseudomonadota bacterium]